MKWWPFGRKNRRPEGEEYRAGIYVDLTDDAEYPIAMILRGLEATGYEPIGAQLTTEKALALAQLLRSTVQDVLLLQSTKGVH